MQRYVEQVAAEAGRIDAASGITAQVLTVAAGAFPVG